MPHDNSDELNTLLEKSYQLSERITEQKIIHQKDIERIDQTLNTLDKKLNDDIKQELWDIKQNIKKISQNEKDIVALNEHTKALEIRLDIYKDLLKQKEERWYKNISIWLSVSAILISAIISFSVAYFNYSSKSNNSTIQLHGDNNVSSNSQK